MVLPGLTKAIAQGHRHPNLRLAVYLAGFALLPSGQASPADDLSRSSIQKADAFTNDGNNLSLAEGLPHGRRQGWTTKSTAVSLLSRRALL
jgi:hypothetical protein